MRSSVKCFYKGGQTEVVNQNKYLGVTIQSKLSWQSHLKVKSVPVKFAINSILWHVIFNNNKILLSTNMFPFNALVR